MKKVKYFEKILKFGGSSVETPERIKNVIEIIKKTHESSPIAVVVSAFGGITNRLIAIGEVAAIGKEDFQAMLTGIISSHEIAAKSLISENKIHNSLKNIHQTFSEMQKILEGVSLVKELSPKTLDLLMSFGERLSAYIISQALQSKYVDARDLIITDRNFGRAKVNFDETNKNIQKYFSSLSSIPIITGFIGATNENETTTLGRGGSDYTAAIFGAALDVQIIEIWTDVDGVMTADPKKEPNAFPISNMSYIEAMEMSYFGAKVIHPPTIIPALEKKIPLLIKNSFHPEAEGTYISKASNKMHTPICGISSIDNATILRLEGSGMVGVCGIAGRLFRALAEKGVNIILISQGSSEQSICIAVSPSMADLAKEAIETEFDLEMRTRMIDKVAIKKNLSIIAAVGEHIHGTAGTAGKLFGSLGKNGINVVAITQGSSEFNISVAIRKEDEVKAIRAIHETFFSSPKKTLNVYLAGIGLIGSTLLRQIQTHTKALHEDYGLDVRIIGLCDSKSMVFDENGIDLESWKTVLNEAKEQMDVKEFVDKMISFNLFNSVFVDCTSSQAIADAYKAILNANISIITPNKKANSGPFAYYKTLKEIALKKKAKFFYGANVGAGLPILSTIKELVRSGDKIIKIEAILSGTLSYLFNTFIGNTVFSEIVREAQKKGFTEPDPRDDLNGMDIARKLLILIRESNFHLEMDDIEIQKILPDDCFTDCSVEDFFIKLKKYDNQMALKRKEAEKEGKVLRYIAKFENCKGIISLQKTGIDHPFYHLSGNDNIISITSEFYKDTPLVIKGQGAGANVTAGKVFGEIVQLGLNQF